MDCNILRRLMGHSRDPCVGSTMRSACALGFLATTMYQQGKVEARLVGTSEPPNKNAVGSKLHKRHHQSGHRRCHRGFTSDDYLAHFAEKR